MGRSRPEKAAAIQRAKERAEKRKAEKKGRGKGKKSTKKTSKKGKTSTTKKVINKAIDKGIEKGVEQLFKSNNRNNNTSSWSDERLKTDIRNLVTLENGINLYSFRYLWDEKLYVGVMAQDLLRRKRTRDPVSKTDSGYYQVNYKMLGLKMIPYKTWCKNNPC